MVDCSGDATTIRAAMVFHDTPEPSEAEFDRSLRPGSFAEFVGQDQIRDNLRIAIAAARGRSEPLDHSLLCGPPGLGKTTLAHLIAHGMGVELIITSGPALAAPRDLAGTLTRLKRNQVLFVDEIHRLPKALEEYLYSAMEDHAIDVVLDSGPGGRTVRLGVQPFTLVGATTREGLLSAAFRSRFGIVERLEPYPPADLEQILQRAAGRLHVQVAGDAASLLALRSRGTPRMALRILRRVRDLAQVEQRPVIDRSIAVEALDRLRIDALGLEEIDRKLLRAIADRNEPVGLKTLAAMVDEAEDTIEEVLEPHLLRSGLLARTPRGRMLTARAYDHLGLPHGSARDGELPFPA
jgi:Holliday junction DNA helicase RuvB